MLLFGTKAETLELLQNRLKTAKVLHLCKFTFGEWCNHTSDLVFRVNETFGSKKVIVRSYTAN